MTVLRRTRLEISKPEIESFFQTLDQSVFTLGQLDTILEELRPVCRLPQALTIRKFAEFLIQQTALHKNRLPFSYRPMDRYTWGEAHPYVMAASLREHGYLSHYTALQHHSLASTDEQIIYLNEEQPAKPGGNGGLVQERIDAAFRRPARVSGNCAPWKEWNFCILNGMQTNDLGVIEVQLSTKGRYRVTGIERTLIDITVRPAYSGGVETVLSAYKKAAGKISVKALAEMLKALNYTYPYHQAIGFYLDRSGQYPPDEVALIRKRKQSYDFYLAHQMSAVSYSKEWRLYYPSSLDHIDT